MIVKQKILNRKEKRALAKKSKNKIEGWMWYSNPYTSLVLQVWFCSHQKSISEKEIVKRIKNMRGLPKIDDKEFINKTLSKVGLTYNDEPLCTFNSKYANGFCLYIDNEPTFIGNEPFFTNEATFHPFIHKLSFSDWNNLKVDNNEVEYIAIEGDEFIEIGTTIFGKLKNKWNIDNKTYDGLLAYSTSFNKNILKASKAAFDYFYKGEPLVVESKDKKWERIFDLLNLKWIKADTFEVDNKKRGLYKVYGYK